MIIDISGIFNPFSAEYCWQYFCQYFKKTIIIYEDIHLQKEFSKVPKSRCHGYQLAEVLGYHQLQPFLTIFVTLLEKKIQRN